jgi:hypothetical protein
LGGGISMNRSVKQSLWLFLWLAGANVVVPVLVSGGFALANLFKGLPQTVLGTFLLGLVSSVPFGMVIGTCAGLAGAVALFLLRPVVRPVRVALSGALAAAAATAGTFFALSGLAEAALSDGVELAIAVGLGILAFFTTELSCYLFDRQRRPRA